MSLTKSLRRILNDKGITVAQLSRMSQVPAKTIYHWLAGQQPRKMEHVFKICDILNVSVEELYGRSRKTPLASEDRQGLPCDMHAGIYEVILRPLKRDNP